MKHLNLLFFVISWLILDFNILHFICSIGIGLAPPQLGKIWLFGKILTSLVVLGAPALGRRPFRNLEGEESKAFNLQANNSDSENK